MREIAPSNVRSKWREKTKSFSEQEKLQKITSYLLQIIALNESNSKIILTKLSNNTPRVLQK